MGSAYLAVSLCLALTTWGVPAVRNRAVRTGMSSACIAIASYIVFKVFQTYNAKTG